MWYSEEEEAEFKRRMMRDVMRCSIKFLDHTNGQRNLTKKDHIRSVGLDHLISRNVRERYEAVLAGRRHHSAFVRNGQRLQRSNGVTSPEFLASLSRANSLRARERAYKVAVFVSNIDDMMSEDENV